MANRTKVTICDYHDVNAAYRLPSTKGIPSIILCLNNLAKKEQLIDWLKTVDRKGTVGV